MRRQVNLWHFLLLLLLFDPILTAESRVHQSEFDSLLRKGRQLIDQQKLTAAEEIIREALKQRSEQPEALLLLGIVLGKQGRWEASQEVFERVLLLQPDFVSAHLELAGVQYKMGRNYESIRTLRRALVLDPNNDYAQRFLATILYLEEQQIEALYHWNRLGEPRINQIHYSTSAKTTAELLGHLFPLNEGEVLHRQQILSILWKQERFNLGPPFQWRLIPNSSGTWNLKIALRPRTTLAFPKAFLLENSARGLFQQEVAYQYPQDLGSGKHFSGSFRWDTPRKRVKAAARFPFFSSSSDALQLGFDLRDETWNYRVSGTEFLFQTEQLFANYEYLMRDEGSFSIHAGYHHQLFRFEEGHNLSSNPHLVRVGSEWNQLFSLNIADTTRLSWRSRLDTFSSFGRAKSRSWQLSSAVKLYWRPGNWSASGLKLSFRTGLSSYNLPLDHYFILGVGQDEPLPLRAHPTVENGRKGNSPMGRKYALANLEYYRQIFVWRLLEIDALTFSDSAIVSGAPFQSSEKEWFQDVGWGFHFKVMGREVLQILFGFDLKTNSFHSWLGLPGL